MGKLAQASVDYIIIVGLLLTVALIVIALFGLMPDFANNIRVSQEKDFWQIQAKPFSVQNSFYDNETQRVYLALESRADSPLIIKSMNFNGEQLAIFSYNSTLTDGVGSNFCTIQTCKFSPCDCTLSIGAYSNRTIVTEYFGEESDLCAQSAGSFSTNLSITFKVPGSNANLTQTSVYPLPVFCRNSFNN
ncbi:MAG: hypothetical protein WC492_03810 [Candidatus Micrarchaeia archaeon]